ILELLICFLLCSILELLICFLLCSILELLIRILLRSILNLRVGLCCFCIVVRGFFVGFWQRKLGASVAPQSRKIPCVPLCTFALRVGRARCARSGRIVGCGFFIRVLIVSRKRVMTRGGS